MVLRQLAIRKNLGVALVIVAFLLGFFFIIGSAFGSFLNVFIDKIIQGRSLFGRSHCDRCKKILNPWDLVPILSYIVLGGRCRWCRRKISIQYPTVEFLSGFLFASVFYFEATRADISGVRIAYLLAVSAVMLVVAVVDFKYYLIPTTLVFAGALVSLFYDFFFFGSQVFITYVIAAFGAALFFSAIVIVTRGRGMGSGDIILAFLMGMVLGIEKTVLAIFTAFAVGAVISLFLVLSRRKKFKQAIAFGPFLVLGFYIALWWYRPLVSWYLSMF